MIWPLAILFSMLTFMGTLRAEPELVEKEGIQYRVLRAAPARVRILWKDGNDKALGDFPATVRYLRQRGETPELLMNGGIFEPRRIPSGLMVQDGKELLPVNRKDGKGNFYLKPNGVFLISPEGAAVLDVAEYPPKDVEIRYAVQSGPLLLKRGETHPAFNRESKSRLHRNGVGVAKSGEVVLAMSVLGKGKLPNLFEFADLFRSLGCEDALFLDGDLCQMGFGADLETRGNLFASIIAVVKVTAEER